MALPPPPPPGAGGSVEAAPNGCTALEISQALAELAKLCEAVQGKMREVRARA